MFEKNLLNIRTRAKLTQEQLAKNLKIERITYCHYESGKSIIPIARLNDFCNFFNLSIDYVFGFNDNIYKNARLHFSKLLCSQRLKELRIKYNLSQKSLAIDFRTSISTISGYEQGINIIPTTFLYELCKKYKISADYLLGKIDEPKYLE